MLLWLLIPVIERGKNGRASFSRENYNLFSIPETIHFEDVFTENTNGFCYLTIKGAMQLIHLEKIGKIGLIETNLSIVDDSLNFGVNGEITIARNIYGFKKSSVNEDRNGIDGYFFDIPVQIKSCTHGAIEYISNVLDGNNKKYGISVINASLNTLYEIVNK